MTIEHRLELNEINPALCRRITNINIIIIIIIIFIIVIIVNTNNMYCAEIIIINENLSHSKSLLLVKCFIAE